MKEVTSLVFSLRGGFVPTGFSSFPHLAFFEHFRVVFVQGDLWPLLSKTYHFIFTPPHEYSLMGGVGVII